MAFLTRTKRVTDPLHDRVRDRIIGRDRAEPVYVSSGSRHSAAGDSNDGYSSSSSSSPCLSNLLLNCFIENAEGDEGGDRDDDERRSKDDDSDSDSESDRTDAISEGLVSVLRNQNVDRFRNVLLSHVLKAMEVFHSLKPNLQILRRNVMLFLQKLGYNAAVSKTKWESSGGLTAGNYEFIDVVRSDSGVRYFVELNFAGEFEIARQTNQYRRLSQNLPTVFVGKSEDLKQIVKLISDAARLSLKSKGLVLPPWRKNRYMQNKWFGPYRRTVNYMPTGLSSPFPVPAKATTSVVKCRSIGFNAVNNPPLLPAATRTR